MAHVFRGPWVFEALVHAFSVPKVPNLGSCFQRPRIFGSWLMFSEDQGSWLMFSEDQYLFTFEELFLAKKINK